MTSNAKTFSTTLHCTDKTVGADIPADPAARAPAPVLGGVLAMDCTDENCLPPIKPRVVKGIKLPDIAPFRYDLPVQITQGPAGQPCVIATTTGMGSVAILVYDPAQHAPCEKGKCAPDTCAQGLCGMLCKKLVECREAAGLKKETKFYVYRIEAAPDELALKGKLIAVPVPPGQPGNQAETT
jgi:hypothetical protein